MADTNTGLPNISDVVQPADLNTWAGIAGALRYLVEPLDPPPAPTAAWPVASGTMANVYANGYAAARTAGIDHVGSIKIGKDWAWILGMLGAVAAFVIELLALVLTPAAQVILGTLDAVRKGIDPSVAILSVSVLNEFLGTEYTAGQLPLGLGSGDHLQRAQQTGQILLKQLTAEFAPPIGSPVGPSTAPAATFTGLAVNFGLASGIMGLIGGLVPWGHVDELRELGEEVSTNIGLGRLVRRALTPLVQILVAKPMEWWVNTTYTPTQFSLGELVNPYAQTAIPQAMIFQSMNLLGYSADKIQAFIQMHEKRLTVHDVYLMQQLGGWDGTQATTYVESLGYHNGNELNILALEDFREQFKWYDKLVAAMEAELLSGVLTVDEFSAVLSTLPYSKAVQLVILATAQYKQKAHMGKPLRQLSFGQIKSAFENGLLTESEIRDRWTAERYTATDQDVLMFLLLLDLQKVEAAAAAKAAKATNAKAKATVTPSVPTTVINTPPASGTP